MKEGVNQFYMDEDGNEYKDLTKTFKSIIFDETEYKPSDKVKIVTPSGQVFEDLTMVDAKSRPESIVCSDSEGVQYTFLRELVSEIEKIEEEVAEEEE